LIRPFSFPELSDSLVFAIQHKRWAAMAVDQSSPPQKTEGEREFTEAQVEESGRLMQEMPRIEGALKNYLSLKLAEGLALPDEAGAEASGTPSATSSAALQGCARVLLKTLNALELPPAPEWSQRYPQGEEERGMDFVARIGDYKVVQALWSKCLAAGQKPAKMLGKSSLRFVLPEVISQVLADASSSAAAAKATEEELRSFLTGFDSALSADAADPSSDAAIVWCEDLRTALAARQAARKAEAEERLARQKTADGYADELRATLTGQVPPNSSVQIEEVEESQQTKE
jgi:hypothetical protein